MCKEGTVYNPDSGKCLEEDGHTAAEREVIEKWVSSREGGSVVAGILGGLLLLRAAAFLVYRYKCGPIWTGDSDHYAQVHAPGQRTWDLRSPVNFLRKDFRITHKYEHIIFLCSKST